MITVVFDKNSDNKIIALFMNGHAGYAEEGFDIICSAASTLFYTAVNSLSEMCGLDPNVIAEIKEDSGDGEVHTSIKLSDIDKSVEDKVQTIMETILCGFKTLEMSANSDGNKYIELIESI